MSLAVAVAVAVAGAGAVAGTDYDLKCQERTSCMKLRDKLLSRYVTLGNNIARQVA